MKLYLGTLGALALLLGLLWMGPLPYATNAAISITLALEYQSLTQSDPVIDGSDIPILLGRTVTKFLHSYYLQTAGACWIFGASLLAGALRLGYLERQIRSSAISNQHRPLMMEDGQQQIGDQVSLIGSDLSRGLDDAALPRDQALDVTGEFNRLVGAWCDRRELGPLRTILQAWPIRMGLTGEFRELAAALKHIQAMYHDTLPQEETERVRMLWSQLKQALDSRLG